MNADAIKGCLLGTAVGDALGLPFEGLSPTRAARLFKDRDRYHFFFKKGMVSDDTEHTCLVAQALIASAGEPEAFSRRLAWGLRFWFLGLPAGIGFATLKSCLKLWAGFPPSKSGVFSAGNGPAMRTAIIGVCFGADLGRMKELIRYSTFISHTDPKAFQGALSVALAAHLSATTSPVDARSYRTLLVEQLDQEMADEFLWLVDDAIESVQAGQTTMAFIQSKALEKGVTGYIYHTVPAVIHAWLSHPDDFRSAMRDILACGGDTDTTAAILGGIVGAGVGKQGIPEAWLDGLIEWPRTIKWMETLAQELSESLSTTQPRRPPRLSVPGIAVRNFLFTVIVLLHGVRRLFPPY